ncbi:unnamed protein product [Protopolystoma xenopodis]|uniref:Phosphatidylinositol-4,5-bisphosphate 4-phosphatase n=1 Tax=Protopolystoma xenopodis TaxID=117903 RepID=A0A448WX05_9PLAT|nr:unnamed protein product [Protopolystoma xenopodis]
MGHVASQPTISCQVCNYIVPLTNKEKHTVIKCPNCLEAIPFEGDPPGKQYVGCVCNCLLICRASTSRVGCSRPHCYRIILLSEV